jgi:hypothetical protein
MEEQKPLIELPATLREGKDELNLAEFPLCSLADRIPRDQKTLSFEDRIWDESRGEMITRRLTVTGAEQHGLPTRLDDEVLLGLIQLSKCQGFADRHVQFTRYQLIRLLGWRDESRSYQRIETSLNRWVGVTLYYDNAWRDRRQQRWVNEKFHVLDNVTLFDRERGGRPPQLPLSSFTWNDVLFRSFQAGNVRSLDFEFFKRLESAIAKRMFRFLDKRFYHRRRWEFDLKEFAWEHISLARSYDAGGLKRKLRPAIAELERQGFLTALPDSSRFFQLQCGPWRVVFEKTQRAAEPAATKDQSVIRAPSLVAALIERHVAPSAAAEVVAAFPAERVQAQLEVFDWLVARNDSRASRNPAGFLISSIRGGYAPPKGFLTRAEREAREKKATERKRKADQRQREREARLRARADAREQAIARFWRSMSEEERRRLEEEALQEAKGLSREFVERRGTLADTVRNLILDAYALKMMQLEG